MRIEKECVAVKVDQVCDRCGEGFMRPTGMSLMSNPPQYPHRCENCDAHQNFHATYPRIEYKEKE